MTSSNQTNEQPDERAEFIWLAEALESERNPHGHYTMQAARALRKAAAMLEAATQPGCLSNCDTCINAHGSPAHAGFCRAFYDEPNGVCQKWQDPQRQAMTDEQPDECAELIERCREILAWQKTGILTGDALRNYAKAKYADDYSALQMAEADTAREAYAAMLEADAQRPAMKLLTQEQIQDMLGIGNPSDEEYRLIRLGWCAAHGIKEKP